MVTVCKERQELAIYLYPSSDPRLGLWPRHLKCCEAV